MSLTIRSLRFQALLTLVALASCASPQKQPLQGPGIDALVSYYAGDPIGGPTEEKEALALSLIASDAVPVTSRLYLLTELPGQRFTPLTQQVRMIVAGGGSEPLAPNSLLTPGTRLVSGDEAVTLTEHVKALIPYEATLSASFEALTLPHVTTRLAASHVQAIELADFRPTDRQVSLELWREDPDQPQLSIALVLSDVAEDLVEQENGELKIVRRPRHEKLVLNARLESSERPLAIYAPARFDPEGRLAYLLVLEMDKAPAGEAADKALESQLMEVISDVRDAAIEGANRRQQLLLSDRVQLRQLHAIEALSNPAHSRSAIFELAGGAPIAMDLALMASAELIAKFITQLEKQGELLRELAGEPDAMSWRLEREAVLLFTGQISEQEMPTEYTALLIRRTGEIGRYPGILEDAVLASTSIATFYARVFEENMIALEDSSPSSRVRSYDWLSDMGTKIPDYDPLDSSAKRRTALRAWEDSKIGSTLLSTPEATKP